MSPGPFAGLVLDEQVGEVTLAFEEAVARSFVMRPPLHVVRRDAIKERFEHLSAIFKVLRGDLKWSLARIKDHLLPFLLKKLDGEDWTPGPGEGYWNAPAAQ